MISVSAIGVKVETFKLHPKDISKYSKEVCDFGFSFLVLNPDMDILEAVKEAIIEENKMLQELHEQKTERSIRLKNAMCKNVYALIHLKTPCKMAFTDLELFNILNDIKKRKEISKALINKLNDRFCFLSAVNDKFDLRIINNQVVREYLDISIILKQISQWEEKN